MVGGLGDRGSSRRFPYLTERQIPSPTMLLGDSQADAEFRAEIRDWMASNLTGRFEQLRFRGGPGLHRQECRRFERHRSRQVPGWPEAVRIGNRIR